MGPTDIGAPLPFLPWAGNALRRRLASSWRLLPVNHSLSALADFQPALVRFPTHNDGE
jgi:hypothetical protein